MFKAGDKVRCIDPYTNRIARGQIVEVLRSHDGYTRVKYGKEENEYVSWRTARFELVQAAIIPPKHAVDAAAMAAAYVKGDKLICVEAYNGVNKIAKNAIVTFVEARGANIKVEEYPGIIWAAKRFQKAVIKPKEIEPGDKVVFARPDNIPGYRDMNHRVGGVYTTGPNYRGYEEQGDDCLLLKELNYYVHRHCLDLVVPEVVAIIPPPKDEEAVKPKHEYKGDLLADLRKKKGNNNLNHHITSFAVVLKDAKEPTFYINPACYAPMTRLGASCQLFAIDTSCHAHQYKGREQQVITYFNYLFNASPWADCFISKDGKEALEKGIMMNCNRPLSEIVGAGIAVREAIERPNRMEVFTRFIERGYGGNIAYLLSISVAISKAGNGYAHIGCGSGHDALTTDMPTKGLISFFKNGFPDQGKKPANDCREGYAIFDAVVKGYQAYGDRVAKPFTEFISTNCKAVVSGEGFNKKSSINEESIRTFIKAIEQYKGE